LIVGGRSTPRAFPRISKEILAAQPLPYRKTNRDKVHGRRLIGRGGSHSRTPKIARIFEDPSISARDMLPAGNVICAVARDMFSAMRKTPTSLKGGEKTDK